VIKICVSECKKNGRRGESEANCANPAVDCTRQLYGEVDTCAVLLVVGALQRAAGLDSFNGAVVFRLLVFFDEAENFGSGSRDRCSRGISRLKDDFSGKG